MDSPYRINNNKKKKPKQSLDTKTENNSKNENTKSVIDESSKNEIIEKRIKNKLKNDIKGGNISDIHTKSGKELIDHAFENDKVNSISENKQEDSSKFITIARKMVNNN